MAAAQDGGAPRDPARVAQFGRRAGGRPLRAPSGPRPRPAGTRGAAESGLRAAFVSHRGGGPVPPGGFRFPRPAALRPRARRPRPPAAPARPCHGAARRRPPRRGRPSPARDARARGRGHGSEGQARVWPARRRRARVCGLLRACSREVSVAAGGTVCEGRFRRPGAARGPGRAASALPVVALRLAALGPALPARPSRPRGGLSAATGAPC